MLACLENSTTGSLAKLLRLANCITSWELSELYKEGYFMVTKDVLLAPGLSYQLHWQFNQEPSLLLYNSIVTKALLLGVRQQMFPSPKVGQHITNITNNI